MSKSTNQKWSAKSQDFKSIGNNVLTFSAHYCSGSQHTSGRVLRITGCTWTSEPMLEEEKWELWNGKCNLGFPRCEVWVTRTRHTRECLLRRSRVCSPLLLAGGSRGVRHLRVGCTGEVCWGACFAVGLDCGVLSEMASSPEIGTFLSWAFHWHLIVHVWLSPLSHPTQTVYCVLS